MEKIFIFQIFYNAQVKGELDPGFIPLDNEANIRSDWREYWLMRNYLLSNDLEEESLYGFFSPKFKQKTGLQAADCYKFIGDNHESIDVFSFSPFFDIGAWHLNSFSQAIQQHPNSRSAIINSLNILSPAVALETLVMHSGNTIFCNYFVAKPKFWRLWLETCELIFSEAEANNSKLSKDLNTAADRHHSNAPIKTFIIERIASLILATDDQFKVKSYEPFMLPFAPTRFSKELTGLIQLDSLKIAYAQSGRAQYLNLFESIRLLIEKKIINA